MTAKTPSEFDRANRMFAIEQAVKVAAHRPETDLVDQARGFYGFLSEANPVQSFPVGFVPDDTNPYL